jgi:hypothetical protein
MYFDSRTYLFLRCWIATSHQIILLVGGIEIKQLHNGGRIEIQKNSLENLDPKQGECYTFWIRFEISQFIFDN